MIAMTTSSSIRVNALSRRASFNMLMQLGFTLYSSPQSKPSLKHDFRYCDQQKYRAHQRVEPEESQVDPIEAPPARNPMLQEETTHDDDPAHKVRDAEPAEQSKSQQQPTHNHVCQERGLQR